MALAHHPRRWRTAAGFAGIAGISLIEAVDALIWDRPLSRPVLGACDESAHLATAGILLSAWAANRTRTPSGEFVAAALGSAVLLDLDHVPRDLFGSTVLTRGTHRPYGHSLLTVLAAAAGSRLLRTARGRSIASGIAAGTALHLVRDLATGGVPLLWPLTRRTVKVPYPGYVALLAAATEHAAAAHAAVTHARAGRSPARRS